MTATHAQQLDAARRLLRDLEVRLKPVHPDIARVKIDDFEKKDAAAVSRKSRIISSSAAAQQAPTHALRVKVSASTTASAGMTSVGHSRDLVMNSTRASARLSASIVSPENVMYRPSVPRGRCPRLS